MRKFFISLGACAVAVAVGLGALLSTKENRNIAKADTYEDIGNIEFSNFVSNIENLDITAEPDVYWFSGDFKTNYPITFERMSIEVYENQSEDYRLSNIKIYAGSNVYYIYDKEFTSDWYTYKFDEAFRGVGVGVEGGNPTSAIGLINQLWTILPLNVNGETTQFQFANQINYYAPYDVNIGSDFASDSTMATNSLYVFKTIYEGFFVSGGQLFNVIRARYVNAIGLLYQAEGTSSAYSTWSSDNNADNKRQE